MVKLRDLAKVCKSKNAGPFEVTLDIIFGDRETYDRVEASKVLNAELFARLYSVPAKDVLFTPYAPALAFKATIPRRISSGDVGDTDVYGAQQHAPMLDIEIPIELSDLK
jgi:hypothetical protein